MSKAKDRMNIDEKSVIGGIIRHDQTLTPEQRADYRRSLGLERFKESLARINRLLKLNAPDPIIANAVTNLYSRAWTLWEEYMGREMVDRFKHVQRERSHRCTSCGIDLPYPIDPNGAGLCAACTITDDEVEPAAAALARLSAATAGESAVAKQE